MKKIIKELEDLKLYRQSRVNRWQLRDYMFTQNDAEHQLFVSQIIIYLSYKYNICKDTTFKALQYACVHDYVESVETSLGDVNYAVKRDNPKLKQFVKELELQALETVPAFYSAYKECEKDKTADTLVHLADAIDALLYVRRELRHNKNIEEWLKIEKEASERIEILFKELRELKCIS